MNMSKSSDFTNDFTVNSASDIHQYFYSLGLFENDDQTKYFLIDKRVIENNKSSNGILNITGWQSLHIICFNHDGSM